MNTEGLELDGWNYALFSLEIILNLLFIPVDFLLFYACITQKNLHVNFRSILFLTAVGYLVSAMHRLIMVPIRLFYIGLQITPFVSQFLLMQYAGVYTALFGSMFVVIERAIASACTSTYEAQCNGYIVPSILCSAVVFFFATVLNAMIFPVKLRLKRNLGNDILLVALICFITNFKLIPNFGMYIMGIQIVVVILCLSALIVIVTFNVSTYKKRHSVTAPLSNKYQVDENIRVGRTLIPIALNDVLSQVIIILLMTYTFIFTDIPLGHDTTHLSHAFDLLLSYQRMFFGLTIVLRSEKLNYLLNRRKRTSKIMEGEAAAASNHFKELKEMWS